MPGTIRNVLLDVCRVDDTVCLLGELDGVSSQYLLTPRFNL